jgi:hypothetical protein
LVELDGEGVGIVDVVPEHEVVVAQEETIGPPPVEVVDLLILSHNVLSAHYEVGLSVVGAARPVPHRVVLVLRILKRHLARIIALQHLLADLLLQLLLLLLAPSRLRLLLFLFLFLFILEEVQLPKLANFLLLVVLIDDPFPIVKGKLLVSELPIEDLVLIGVVVFLTGRLIEM